jgi:hypothetical protein
MEQSMRSVSLRLRSRWLSYRGRSFGRALSPPLRGWPSWPRRWCCRTQGRGGTRPAPGPCSDRQTSEGSLTKDPYQCHMQAIDPLACISIWPCGHISGSSGISTVRRKFRDRSDRRRGTNIAQALGRHRPACSEDLTWELYVLPCDIRTRSTWWRR